MYYIGTKQFVFNSEYPLSKALLYIRHAIIYGYEESILHLLVVMNITIHFMQKLMLNCLITKVKKEDLTV